MYVFFLFNTFKHHHRYVVVKIELENDTIGGVKFTDYAIYNGILKLVQKHYGDLGHAAVKSGLKCKYCNDQTRIAIIRIKHRPHRFVTSVLPLANVLGEHRLKLRTLYNGATIMQCNKFIVKHQRQYLDQRLGEATSAGQQKHLLRRVMSYATC